MKTKTVLFMGIALFLLMVGMGCKEEPYSPPSDPQKAILGKWKIIEAGGCVDCYPNMIIEYLPDSLIRYYDEKNPKGIILSQQYFFRDSLFIQFERSGGKESPSALKSKYKFYNDKFYYEYININAMIPYYTLQRINN